jgi:hypothetical protein
MVQRKAIIFDQITIALLAITEVDLLSRHNTGASSVDHDQVRVIIVEAVPSVIVSRLQLVRVGNHLTLLFVQRF